MKERRLECSEGVFVFSTSADARGRVHLESEVSSWAKQAFRGLYHRKGGDGDSCSVPAVAVFNASYAGVGLSREMTALGRGHVAGFGPRLLASTSAAAPGGDSDHPLVVTIEEDVGVSLFKALEGAQVPGADPCTLAPAGTETGDAQTAKILFDVTCQVLNMHNCGMYHHDIKTSNICVRMVGNRPKDIRATIIDFDHTMDSADGSTFTSTADYCKLLFGKTDFTEEEAPSSLARDLGCLAAVWTEVKLRQPLYTSYSTRALTLSRDDVCSSQDGIQPFFWYSGGEPRVRRLSKSDLMPLADRARLEDAGALDLPRDAGYDLSLFKSGKYMDAGCMRQLREKRIRSLGDMEDRLARAAYDNYLRVCRELDQDVEEVPFDKLEHVYIQSNYAQAAGVITFLWRLGYEVVLAGAFAADELAGPLSADEVLCLARWEHERWKAEREQVGWTCGETDNTHGDAPRKVNPRLVPFEKLKPDDYKFNLKLMQGLLPTLRQQGIGLIRRRQQRIDD